MALRAGRTPNMPRVANQENVRQNMAAFQEAIDRTHRTNLAFPKDGTEPFEAPAPLQHSIVADLPAAADWEGSIIYVSNEAGGKTIAFSDGTNWRRVQDRAIVT